MARKKKTLTAKKSTAKAGLPLVKIEPYTENLKCILTKDEVADRADRAAALLQDRDSKEEEQKARAKAAKAEIDSLEAELRRVSNEVRTKAAYQDVRCERRYIYSKGKVQEWRLDTGAMVFERELLDTEKQRELPFNDGEDQDEAEDDDEPPDEPDESERAAE